MTVSRVANRSLQPTINVAHLSQSAPAADRSIAAAISARSNQLLFSCRHFGDPAEGMEKIYGRQKLRPTQIRIVAVTIQFPRGIGEQDIPSPEQLANHRIDNGSRTVKFDGQSFMRAADVAKVRLRQKFEDGALLPGVIH